jgi:MFS family permease
MAPKSSFQKILRQFACADYVALLRVNRNYRLYVISHMCQHAGDWFVRIAALISVQRITAGSATALSIVVMCRTIPELALAPFGGILADTFDRRNVMIKLDLLAALSVCLFIQAVKANSVHLLYLATVIRSIISATYMPITGAIVPQIIVSGKEDLKRAATLNGMIWSGMLVIGGVVAGGASARFGVEVCYFIDILTFIISAVIMSGVSGNFLADADVDNPPQDTKGNDKETIAVKMLAPLCTLYQMKKELILYLWYSGFGALVFLKASGCFIWGAADILNVSFSHIENDEAESSRRMGALYSSIGIGCLIGPIVANSTIVDGKKPATLQLAILFGLAMMTIGWLGVASNASSFKLVCFFTGIRTTGSSLIWLFSTLLMQVRPIAFFASVLNLLLLHLSTLSLIINSLPPTRTLLAQKY